MSVTASGAPRRAPIFGPETWATIAGAEWCYFDQWFALVTVTDFGKLQKGAEGSIVGGLSVLEDGDGKLWVAAFRAGVNKYDGKQKTNYPIKEGETAIEVFAVYKDNRGGLWLGTHNGGAYKFNGKTFEKWRP